MVNIVSVNVNGLRDVSKFQRLCSFFDENCFDVVAIQETFWDEDFIADHSNMWKGKIISACSNNARQGVAFLVNKKYQDKVDVIAKLNGRFLHIKISENDKVLDFINVYFPNIIEERVKFCQDIHEYIPKSENLFLLGDFNTSMSSLDRGGKLPHVEDRAYKALNNLLDEYNLYDIWRSRNPDACIFSWRRVVQNVLSQSRIDFIFCSKNISPFVKNVYYKHNVFSDHSLVVLNADFSQVERGPGLWIFNNTLLNDEVFVEKIDKLIQTEKQCPLFESEILVWIDNLKYKIKKLTQVYAKDKKKRERSEYFKLQKEFEKISERAAKNLLFDINKYEEIKVEMKKYEDKICSGAILRSKAHWAIEGDKNSKYFLELEKHRQESNSIKELQSSDGKILQNTDEILEEIYDYYKKLFSCTSIHEEKMFEISNFISKKVSDDQKQFLDSDITRDEIFKSLNEMSKNKSPGGDGITVSFYCKFFHHFGEILEKVFKAIENEKRMSRSMRHGIITLIYKNKGEKNILKNYRPISLLAVDYKILARIMANRLKLVLPSIISEFQTCCIIGRDIADTTASIRDVIELIEQDNLEGYLIKVDQQNAFDRVDHKYLFYILEKFGFGQKFIDWMKIFYTDIFSSVKCNGFLTKYAPLKNSIKQGCPISALLYVLAAEPLGQALLQNKNIKGIKIPKSEKESKYFAHADDTSLTVSDKNSISEIFNVLDLYSRASGAKINKQKSEIMCLGSGHVSDNELKKFQVKLCENTTKLLGIYMGKDKKSCESQNWTEKIKKIKTILYFWTKRDLTLPSRITVLSSLIMSRLYYTVTVCSLPEKIKNEIRLIVLKFLWNNKAHLVKYQTIVGKKCDGGLNLPDIFLRMKAFRLKFLRKFLDESYNAIWKNTFNYFLTKIDNLNLQENSVYCLFNSKQLNNLPDFYQEMFVAFYELKSKIEFSMEAQHVYENPIFCNPLIKYNNKSLLFHEFITAGITQIKHICYEVIPGFLPENAIVEIVQEKIPEISTTEVKNAYKKILSAIPDAWIDILKIHNPINITHSPEIFLKFGIRVIDFKNATSKILYDILLCDFFQRPTSENFWLNKFPMLNFTSVYSTVHIPILPPDIHCLNYRLAMNSIFTLEKLHKINKTDSDTCLLCGLATENLDHLFVSCDSVQGLKVLLTEMLHNCLVTSSNPSHIVIPEYTQLILLGWPIQTQKKDTPFNIYWINFILGVARLSIYKTRQIKVFEGKQLDCKRLFIYTLKKYTEYAYKYYTLTSNHVLFEKYFLHKNPILQCSNSQIRILF